MASDKAYVKHSDGRSEWNVEILRQLGFKKGSIIRVHMKNFLTYDYSMVFPGPRLNVILGPNGTGKSTITHAICLACAGSAATVGRSPAVEPGTMTEAWRRRCCLRQSLRSSSSCASLRPGREC